MTDKQPAAVVVGTGFGLFTHTRALRAAGFEVRWIVGRDRKRTEQRAAPVDIPNATDNLEEALADPDVVLVTVATPPHAHARPVHQALAAKRHVVCEKPFALNVEEARGMRDAARQAGVFHMLGAEFRFDVAQAHLRRVVKSGEIGQPLHFLRIFHQNGNPDPNEELHEWWEKEETGGGFLGAFGSHMFDQVNYTFDPIARVSGQLQVLAPGRPQRTADDCYSVQFETGNGVKGTVVAAMVAPGQHVQATKVIGTRGGAWIQSGAQYGDPEEVWVSDGMHPRKLDTPADLVYEMPTPFPVTSLIQTEMDRWHTTGFDVPPYRRLFEEMRARIEGHEPKMPERAATFDDAVRVQAILDAVRCSSREGRWLDVD